LFILTKSLITMSFLPMQVSPEAAFFNDDINELGIPLRDQYLNADPFAYIQIDDFLPPEVLQRILDAFPAKKQSEESYERAQERYKSNFNPEQFQDSFSRTLFYAFNAAPFLKFLESLTGYKGLVPDPYFFGGGLHETVNGGHLSIHADYNLNETLSLKRRVNVLIYLNQEWDENYGGNLELWEKDMSKKAVSVAPLFNRCVVFSTEDDTFHGHPDPLTMPEDRSRRSIALYYYTASQHIYHEYKNHTTLFERRKDSTDKVDYSVRINDFIRDCIPPIVMRQLQKMKK